MSNDFAERKHTTPGGGESCARCVDSGKERNPHDLPPCIWCFSENPGDVSYFAPAPDEEAPHHPGVAEMAELTYSSQVRQAQRAFPTHRPTPELAEIALAVLPACLKARVVHEMNEQGSIEVVFVRNFASDAVGDAYMIAEAFVAECDRRRKETR